MYIDKYEFNINNPKNVVKYDNNILKDIKISDIFYITKKQIKEDFKIKEEDIIGDLSVTSINISGIIKFDCKIFNEEYYNLIFKEDKYKITPYGIGRLDIMNKITGFTTTVSDHTVSQILYNVAKIIEQDVDNINNTNNELKRLISITNDMNIKTILTSSLINNNIDNNIGVVGSSRLDKIKIYEDALKKIIKWELPETGLFYDEQKTQPVSYSAQYGTNGERNYFRNLAINALNI